MTLSPRQTVLDQLHRLGGTSPSRALTDRRALTARRAGNLVLNTVFRTLCGRYPSAEERASLIRQAAEGVSFEDLVAEVAETEASVDLTLERIRPLVQAWLRLDFDRRGAAAPGSGEKPRLVFLHIMKTGGVSLSHVCVEVARASGPAWAGLYADDLLLRPPAMLAQASFLAGHIPYEALKVIPGAFKTATVLREPVSRAVSHFVELQRSGPPYDTMTLDQFASVEDPFGPAGNYQTRQLAHRVGIADAWTGFNPYDRLLRLGAVPNEYPVSGLFDTVPVDRGDDEMLETAKANLASIDVVGITESLGRMIEPMAAVFGAAAPAVPHMHASPALDPAQLTDSVRKRLEAHTELDRELYDQARQRARSRSEG